MRLPFGAFVHHVLVVQCIRAFGRHAVVVRFIRAHVCFPVHSCFRIPCSTCSMHFCFGAFVHHVFEFHDGVMVTMLVSQSASADHLQKQAAPLLQFPHESAANLKFGNVFEVLTAIGSYKKKLLVTVKEELSRICAADSDNMKFLKSSARSQLPPEWLQVSTRLFAPKDPVSGFSQLIAPKCVATLGWGGSVKFASAGYPGCSNSGCSQED